MRAIGNRARAPAPWLLAVVQRARRFRHLLRFAHESVAPGGLLKTFPKQPAQTEVPCRISGLIDTQPADGEFRSQHRMPTSIFRYRTHHSPLLLDEPLPILFRPWSSRPNHFSLCDEVRKSHYSRSV